MYEMFTSNMEVSYTELCGYVENLFQLYRKNCLVIQIEG